MREARGLAKFNSVPEIVSVYDFFEANGTAYIVMEYLSGQNLKEYWAGLGNQITYDYVYYIADKLCSVLSVVHSNGIIHRDISPDNIFLCEDGTIKLIDFGALTQDMSDMQGTMTIIVKHGFAPIEQYYGKGNIGPWTDIYALGATLYYLLTNQMPQDSVERMVQDQLQPPHILNPEVPINYSMAIMRAMAIDWEARYRNIEEFHNALYGGATYESSDVGVKDSMWQEMHDSKVKHSKPMIYRVALIMSGAVGLIVLITILVLLVNNFKQKETDFISQTGNHMGAYTEEQQSNSATTFSQISNQDTTQAATQSPTTEKSTDHATSQDLYVKNSIFVMNQSLLGKSYKELNEYFGGNFPKLIEWNYSDASLKYMDYYFEKHKYAMFFKDNKLVSVVYEDDSYGVLSNNVCNNISIFLGRDYYEYWYYTDNGSVMEYDWMTQQGNQFSYYLNEYNDTVYVVQQYSSIEYVTRLGWGR